MLGAAHGQQGHDVASSKATPNGSRNVAAIPEHTVWSLSRSAPCALQRGNRIDQRQGFLRVVRFAPVRRTASGTPRPSQSRWRLLPRLARSVGFGPVWSPPYTARMQQLSRTARDQSIWSLRASQSRSAKWIRSHTPACCQSRKRRQHVIPDPHASSCGSICQGTPLRRTKTMPVSHARSETRGRPPFGRRGGIGKSGSTRSHNASGSSAAAMSRSRYLADEVRLRRFC